MIVYELIILVINAASLQTLGGKDVMDITRRILTRIISNDVACQFKWTGKNDKPAFKELKQIINLTTGKKQLFYKTLYLCVYSCSKKTCRSIKCYDTRGGKSYENMVAECARSGRWAVK